MAMVDVLAHAREKALKEVNPHLMTIATLTGHAAVAMGPYTAVMDNGAARKEQFAQKLFMTGEQCGDPFEGMPISTSMLYLCNTKYILTVCVDFKHHKTHTLIQLF